MKKQLAELAPILTLLFGVLWLAVCVVVALGAWSVVRPPYYSWGVLLAVAVLWCPLSFILYELIWIAVGVAIAIVQQKSECAIPQSPPNPLGL